MKSNNFLAALGLLLGMLTGQGALASTPIENCDILYAGQNSNAGLVCVTVDADVGTVTVDYKLDLGWTLSEAHAWVGENLALMPQNRKGNPQVGRFPHSASGLGGVNNYSFVIPLSDLPINADTFCEAQVFVAAHAVVARSGKSKAGTQTESAWAGSEQVASGGSWARNFSFTNNFCDNRDDPVVVPESCFNVFGKGVDAVSPVAANPITPTGVTDTNFVWLNTFSSTDGYFGGDLVSGGSVIIGSFLAGPLGSPTFTVELTLDNLTPSLKIRSANIYFDAATLYRDMSPLYYNLSIAGNGTGSLGKTVPWSSVPSQIDTIVHAIICPSSVAD